jgi:alkylhydroperoxidase family enzyme
MDNELLEQLRRTVFGSPGATDPATRLAAGTGEAPPEPLGSYAGKVRDQAYRVSDADIARLRAAGHSEDEIFEITVAAAVGAALRSLEAGLAALSITTTNEQERS